MKFLKAKFLIPIVSALLLLLIIGWFYGPGNESNHYFINTYNSGFEKGSPVYIENVKAGEIEEVIKNPIQMGSYTLRFSLFDDYSIPTKSVVELMDNNEINKMGIRIRVLASKEYFQVGDTLDLTGKDPSEENLWSENQLDKSGKPVYKVQIFVSDKKLNTGSPVLRGIKEVQPIKQDGLYKYYYGNVGSLGEARDLKAYVVQKGISDAFIVPFLDGERISIEQALKYEK